MSLGQQGWDPASMSKLAIWRSLRSPADCRTVTRYDQLRSTSEVAYESNASSVRSSASPPFLHARAGAVEIGTCDCLGNESQPRCLEDQSGTATRK